MYGIRQICLSLVFLMMASFLAGCATVTNEGLLVADTVLIRPIVDYRVPSPEVVEILEEIAEEENIDVAEACIDLMTADEETLQQIIDIGPVRANNIVVLRQLFEFNSPEDLRRIGGIGAKRVERIQDQGLVCING